MIKIKVISYLFVIIFLIPFLGGDMDKGSDGNCYLCKFKTNCIFNELPREAQKKWNEIKSFRKIKDGQTIYNQGEMPVSIFIVCKGRVKISSTNNNGQQLIIWIRHPGEIFGDFALFSQREYDCSAQVMGDSIISLIYRKELLEIMEKHPEIYKLMLKKMATDNKTMQLKLKDSAYISAKSKVAKTLIKHISYKTKDSDIKIIYALKRTEIAEITGITLETVVRILSDLEKKKIIERAKNYIRIINYPLLNKISNS